MTQCDTFFDNYTDGEANSFLNLFSLDSFYNKFTSLEDEGPDGIIRLCATDQILWVDKRHPNKPLLGLKHGRNFDPTLQIQTIQLEHSRSHLIKLLL